MAAARTRLIAALDTDDETHAASLARMVGPHVDALKLGLQFTYASGLPAAERVCAGQGLFLDLKLHDIPNTVACAVRAIAGAMRQPPLMLTLHGAGGVAMLEQARLARDEAFTAAGRPLLLAVTVLTSLDAEALQQTGVAGGPRQQVLRLARLALGAGIEGLVCSPHEIAPLRDMFGEAPVLVVPGVRPEASEAGDQKRVMTPRDASLAGADWIVVGRPITGAPDPAAAAAAIAGMLV